MNDKPDNYKAADREKQSELTPKQKQMRRKLIVLPILFLTFIGCMWLIFTPSKDKDKQPVKGLNTSLPTPEDNSIVSDKRDAYLQDEMQKKGKDKMRSLQDFAFGLAHETDAERTKREAMELRMAPKPVEYHENPARFEDSYSREKDAFHSASSAYQDINRQLGIFYDGATKDDDAHSSSELQKKVEELERQLAESKTQKSVMDEQLALIEKSYEIASKYMGGQTQNSEPTQTIAKQFGEKINAQPVTHIVNNVVSSLSSPLSDSVFKAEYVKPRNWGFNTISDTENMQERNGIYASIYQTVTVQDGGEVTLRLTEPIMIGSRRIQANTIITGLTRLNGERMGITVKSIQSGGNIIPVELTVYDMDGGEGIRVPGSDETKAIKEIAANMGSGLGSSITINDDAGSQLLSDLGRSAIQGVSGYIGNKMRTVKITLKAGYRLLLLPPIK